MTERSPLDILSTDVNQIKDAAFNLMALIGNSEAKLVVGLLPEGGESFTNVELRDRYYDFQQPRRSVTYAAGTAIRQMWRGCHVPAGLFEEEPDERSAKKVKDTELSDAMSGHLLKVAFRYSRGLTEVLDQTAPGKTGEQRRPAVYRVGVLKALCEIPEAESIALRELARVTNLDFGPLHTHVHKMAAANLIDYYSGDIVGEHVKYEILRRPSPALSISRGDHHYDYSGYFRGEKTTWRVLAEYLGQVSDYGDTQVTYLDLLRQFPETVGRAHLVTRATNRAIYEGFLRRIPNALSKSDSAIVNINREQRELAEKMVKVFDGLVTQPGGFVSSGIESSQFFLESPDITTGLLIREAENSTMRKSKPLAATAAEVSLVLSEHGEMTAEMLRDVVDGGRLARTGMLRVLEKMRDNSMIVGRRVGINKFWSLTQAGAEFAEGSGSRE